MSQVTDERLREIRAHMLPRELDPFYSEFAKANARDIVTAIDELLRLRSAPSPQPDAKLLADIREAVDLLLAINKDMHARNPMAVTAIDMFLATRALSPQEPAAVWTPEQIAQVEREAGEILAKGRVLSVEPAAGEKFYGGIVENNGITILRGGKEIARYENGPNDEILTIEVSPKPEALPTLRCTLFTDNFNRSDADLANHNWTENGKPMSIAPNGPGPRNKGTKIIPVGAAQKDVRDALIAALEDMLTEFTTSRTAGQFTAKQRGYAALKAAKVETT